MSTLAKLDRELQLSLTYMSDADKDKLLATPRPDPLSDAISSLQFMRLQLINIAIATKQCETNLDVALRLLQELAARR